MADIPGWQPKSPVQVPKSSLKKGGIVYKVTSPSGKIYIGITQFSLEKRKLEHEKLALRKQGMAPFQKAIRKYKTLLLWETIDTANSWEELCKKEIEYIKFFKSNTSGIGYNVTKGGEGGFGSMPGAKNPMWGKPSPWRGKPLPSEIRKKLSESWTPEKRKYMSDLKGAKPFKVIKVKIIPALRSPRYVKRKIIDIEIIGIWTNQSACAIDLKLRGSYTINKCLNGKKKTYGNYRFEYV